jgi:hypothetical protein
MSTFTDGRGDLRRRRHEKRSFGDFHLVLAGRGRREPSLPGGHVHDRLPLRPVCRPGPLVCPGHEAERVHADRQRRVPILLKGALVEVDVGRESARAPADDGQHQRQAVAGGPDHRLRGATDTNPGGEVSVGEGWAHVLVRERGSDGAGPGNGLVPQQAREQVEFLLEERLVVGEIESEQRERLRRGGPADDELGTAVGHRVGGRELGVHPHRVLGAQYRHGRAEPDALGSAGDRGQHHVACGVHEIGPCVAGCICWPRPARCSPSRARTS